jgi:hypothetical protein
VADSSVVRVHTGTTLACIQRACMENNLAYRPADLTATAGADELRSAGRTRWMLAVERTLGLAPLTRHQILMANLTRMIALTTTAKIGGVRVAQITPAEHTQMHRLASAYLFLMWLGDGLPRMDSNGTPYVNGDKLPVGWAWSRATKKEQRRNKEVDAVREMTWLTRVLDLAATVGVEDQPPTVQMKRWLAHVVSAEARRLVDLIPEGKQTTSCLQSASSTTSTTWPLNHKHYWNIAATILWQITQRRRKPPRLTKKAEKAAHRAQLLATAGVDQPDEGQGGGGGGGSTPCALTHEQIVTLAQIHGPSMTIINGEFRDMAHVMLLFPRRVKE